MNSSERADKEIAHTEEELEARVLEAIRQLEMGRDEALERMTAQGEEMHSVAAQASTELKSISNRAATALHTVQSRLGELNYALAEDGGIKDVECFDRLWTRVCDSIAAALTEIERLEVQGKNFASAQIRQAWSRFVTALELVRMHMEAAAAEGASDFAHERAALATELRELQENSKRSPSRKERLEQLEGAYERFKHIFKALLMHPDESAPFVEKVPTGTEAYPERESKDSEQQIR